MLADLDELDLQFGALGHGRLALELLERALVEDLEEVVGDAFPRLEHETAPRVGLDLGQPARARADHDVGDVVVHCDLERLVAGPGGQPAQLALDVDRHRRVGDDDAVALADGALARQDLARPVRDVLARHLDQAERRDLDDVGLGAIALELVLQRLLDGRAVLRIRHIDEVDDDDPADVAQPELADDLLDGLEVVLRDRVLEPGT